jgi:hypothetical protein
MSEIPYTVLAGKIKTYFDKFQQAGVPSKVDSGWLKSIGCWAGGNDNYIIGVLKFIGFIDSSNAPSELWKSYKDPTKARTALAKGIKEGYKELFDTYPDANRKDKNTLYAFFSAKTGKAKKTVDYMVSTFAGLCQLADFEAEEYRGELEKKQVESEEKGKKKLQMVPQMQEGFAINMNIQITLPITEDAKVYENIFKALREQLFKPE